MNTARRFAIMNPVHTTNFIPQIDSQDCNGCGKCVNVCPVEAMTLVSANNPAKPKMKQARLNEDICLGCGLCAKSCDKNNITLKPRSKRVITPTTGVQKAVIMAIERGKLQNLIFDNRVLWSHRALSAVFGAILKLPAIKKTLAKRQLSSAYAEAIIK
jgi:ferredoxin